MLRPGRFFWKLFLGNALLMAMVLGTAVWLIVGTVERAYRSDLTWRLRSQAAMVRQMVQGEFDAAHAPQLQRLARAFGEVKEADLRLTLIAPDGTVWADSEAEPARMDSHAERPEILQAMSEGWGDAERWSNTVHRHMKYVAVRVDDGQRVLGTVRVSMAVPSIAAHTGTMRELIWGVAAVALAAAVVLALGLAYVWSAPIRRITEAARSLSAGNLSARLPVGGQDEIGQMATSLNQMRESLTGQLHTIDRQRRSLEYLIRTLTEGVIVSDESGRIVLMNPTAFRFLNGAQTPNPAAAAGRNRPDCAPPDLELCVGRPVEACVNQPELRELLLSRNGSKPVGDASGALSLPGEANPRPIFETRIQVDHPAGPVHLLARASKIDLSPDGAGGAGSRGRLVVLTDITELTRTIRMKTDFVANASHELRTPLSTIRAAVETLLQMNTSEDPEAAGHFIQVIDRHTNRLEELVEDLLDLSRLESSSSHFPPEALDLREVLDELHGRFAQALGEKDLRWAASCSRDCERVEINRRLLRLVLENLVANAIKFTDAGRSVSVACHCIDEGVSIEVADEGCGIPLKYQDRVFERFYQVERARSESAGAQTGRRGTGLGLSIVRHAVAAMGGTVSLKSRPGEGTRVTVTIPQGTDRATGRAQLASQREGITARGEGAAFRRR